MSRDVAVWRPDRSDAPAVDRELDELADVLHAVVNAGAGVSFVAPFSKGDARAFWSDTLAGVEAGRRLVLVARLQGRIVGTVQLDLATPPNQAHRAEVVKMLVHPDARRRGLARALMIAVEGAALGAGRTLLTLDTVTGGNAEALYASLGWIRIGTIPRYARGSTTPELESTTLFYKDLSGEIPSASVGAPRPVGRIESALVDRAAAPRQGDEGAPDAWLVFDPEVGAALEGLEPGDEILILSWLDRARRDVLRVHPRDDTANPVLGVFATRSADRPNPIGLHRVRIRAVDGLRLRVGPLEALHGTPILDVKPVLGTIDER